MIPDPTSPSLANTTWTQEARLLVALLRSARLALLFSESGHDAAAFLQSSLLPLLQRRQDDQPASTHPPPLRSTTGVVVPFPDRRRRHAARPPRREVVVLFDDWSGVPLPALLTRLQQAARPTEGACPLAPGRLIDHLHALGERDDVNFIVVLDRFEEFLRLPAQREGIADFTDELVQALNAPQLPANFLLSVADQARPALSALRQRVPGFDDFSLKLPTAAAEPPPARPAAEVTPMATPPSASAPRSAAPPPPVKLPTPLRAPVKTQDVYALIEATLNRTTTDNDCEPFRSSGPGALTALPAEPAPPAPLPATMSFSADPLATASLSAAAEPPPPLPPAAATAPRRTARRRPPTLLERCKRSISRWWRSPRDPG